MEGLQLGRGLSLPQVTARQPLANAPPCKPHASSLDRDPRGNRPEHGTGSHVPRIIKGCIPPREQRVGWSCSRAPAAAGGEEAEKGETRSWVEGGS